MGIIAGLAALALVQQTAKPQKLEQKITALSNDLRQTLTLYDSLKVKVANEKDAKKLVSQFFDKLESIAHTAEGYLISAKTDQEKARISIIRFESLANTDRSGAEIEKVALEIANKYKESDALCAPLEDLTFFQYLSTERYGSFDTLIKQTKNPEVMASAQLASCFVQFLTDAGDINKLRTISIQYEKTKAGQRAALSYLLRTKLVLGQPMIDFNLDLMNGSRVSINSLKGKVVVLNFWGFWNDGSQAELNDIKTYVAKYPTRLSWIGINTDNWTTSFLSQRIKDTGITWSNVAAGSPSGIIPMNMGITNYPAKIIIDAQGVVRYLPGPRDWKSVLDEALDKA